MKDYQSPARLLTSETIVCRCEEIRAVSIREAIDEGALTINDVKRRTRAGMGLCQGVYCTATIATMIADEGGVSRHDVVPMTARPPVRVVPLGSLAALATAADPEG